MKCLEPHAETSLEPSKRILPRSFYLRPDVVTLAQELLGRRLCTRINGNVTSGIITETEAYAGIEDKASHAWNGRRTERTEVMFGPGGFAYVYLCYGIHSLFNVVTNRKGVPHAILIRAIMPSTGRFTMLERLKKNNLSGKMISGPGNVAKALGIHYSHSGLDLTIKPSGIHEAGIWIEDHRTMKPGDRVEATTRVGVGYAGKDALLPYRFILHP